MTKGKPPLQALNLLQDAGGAAPAASSSFDPCCPPPRRNPPPSPRRRIHRCACSSAAQHGTASNDGARRGAALPGCPCGAGRGGGGGGGGGGKPSSMRPVQDATSRPFPVVGREEARGYFRRYARYSRYGQRGEVVGPQHGAAPSPYLICQQTTLERWRLPRPSSSTRTPPARALRMPSTRPPPHSSTRHPHKSSSACLPRRWHCAIQTISPTSRPPRLTPPETSSPNLLASPGLPYPEGPDSLSLDRPPRTIRALPFASASWHPPPRSCIACAMRIPRHPTPSHPLATAC